MATLPTLVQPGDVISSDLMNAILHELARLGGSVGPTGTQVVPNVFGAFLVDARATILQPARQLSLGFIFDVAGAAVDPLAAANFNLVVLNQSPPADARVAPNTPVNLVVSRSSSTTGPQPGTPPAITRTETPTGAVTTTFAVNGTMAIVGTNFNANAAQNVVTFDNTAAVVTSDPADPTRRLLVTVPAGIPGAPVNPGDPPKTGVVVKVQTPTLPAATTTVTVTAPVANQPTIGTVTPLTQFETSNITIDGTNFTPAATVLIRGVAATIVGTPTAIQIVATVPDFVDILPGPPVSASLVVSIPGVGDAAFSGTFRVRGV